MRDFLFSDTPWNLFLAIIPVVAGYLLRGGVERWTLVVPRRVPWPVWLPLFLVWFLFLPNTVYLLTEWRHYFWDVRIPVMYELRNPHSLLVIGGWTLYFVLYSGAGVLTFTLGIRPVRALLRRLGVARWPLAVPFFLLNALGVYLGLIPQWNSWDVLKHFHEIWATSWSTLKQGQDLKNIAFFGLAFWLMFEMTDTWIEGLRLRLGRR
jgi:uncharacterized membrane protein